MTVIWEKNICIYLKLQYSLNKYASVNELQLTINVSGSIRLSKRTALLTFTNFVTDNLIVHITQSYVIRR